MIDTATEVMQLHARRKIDDVLDHLRAARDGINTIVEDIEFLLKEGKKEE